MGERLEKKLAEITSKDDALWRGHPCPRSALMTHVVLGYPSLKESVDLVSLMADAGASIIELQIPFSDPMADGPTIMHANEAALENGVTPKDCMKAMEKLSQSVDVPLLFMTYYQIVFCYSSSMRARMPAPQKRDMKTTGKGNRLVARASLPANFIRDAESAGAEGLIVPDIPLEETGDGYWDAVAKSSLSHIPIVTPITGDERLKKISKKTTSGFVYCVSTTGTTGARATLPKDLASYLKKVRRRFSVPLALGFGISKPQHIRAIGSHADIAVVGSAVINVLRDSKKSERSRRVKRFINSLAG